MLASALAFWEGRGDDVFCPCGLDELRWWPHEGEVRQALRVRDTVSIRVQGLKMGLRTNGSAGSFIAWGTFAPARLGLGLGLEPGIQNYIANEQV
jgi:hypothetical protein